MRISIIVATLFTALPNLAGADTYQNVKVMAGEALFREECRKCHAPDADHPSYGPVLLGVVGRGAGSVADYEYSEAMRNSGIVWTEAALRAWMEDNTGFMPGTKMRHVGIDDRTVQDFIIAYLKTLDE